MPETATQTKRTQATASVVDSYDIAADAKKRISLRRAQAKYFRVMAMSDGSFYLQPRVLVPMKVKIDGVERVPAPRKLQPLLKQLGDALDRLPA